MSDYMSANAGVGGLGNWSIGNGSGFPDPFTDMASLAMPESPQQVLRWCEFIVLAQGAYRTALERVLSYFITDIQIEDASDAEKEKYDDFLNSTIGIKDWLHKIGFDYLTYGNSFVSVLMPFKRYLICSKCYIEFPLKIVYNGPEFHFEWTNYEFHASCPHCQYKGKWKHQDRRGGSDDIKIKRWNPHDIEIINDDYTGDSDYLWKIPADYKKLITEGTLYHLERANMEVIEAIKANQYFRFAKNTIFHLKEDSLSGVRKRGWGVSRVLSNFRQAWYVQILHRYNEAIALDYIIPFRVLTPPPGAKGGIETDPIMNTNLGQFKSQVNAMLRRRRKDPAAWNILPFAIQYAALGGDAKALAPKELLDQGIELLLNNIGVPVELFKGSLQVQTAPAALRLFESHWNHLVFSLDSFLRYVANRISELLSWEKVDLCLTRVTTADDLNKQMAKLQLMTGHQISQSTGLKSIGVSWKEELKKMMEEEKIQAEEQEKMQEEMESAGLMQQMAPSPQQQMVQQAGQQQQGSQSQSGSDGQQQQPATPPSPVQQAMADMPMGNNTEITPQEMMQKAQSLAQQILQLPESQKDSELIKLKKSNVTLHALVKSQIDGMRQQAKTQGGAMLMAQQGMGGSQAGQ